MRLLLPSSTLTDLELIELISKLKIPAFIGALMSDQLRSRRGYNQENNNDFSAIVNLGSSDTLGTHWTALASVAGQRYYFDSFAAPPPTTVLRFLKTRRDFEKEIPNILCNAQCVQADRATNCGALCVYFLYHLNLGVPFDAIIRDLREGFERGRKELWVTTTTTGKSNSPWK